MSIPLRPSVAAGEWVAISGQLGQLDGALVEGGIIPQTKLALENFVAVLAEHDLTPSDVVKTNVFLLDMTDFAAVNEQYAKVFTQHFPARSAVAVVGLPLGGIVEIEGWAYRGTGAAGREPTS